VTTHTFLFNFDSFGGAGFWHTATGRTKGEEE
jgi:hypothetical protein